jgi:hypothetical protein
VLLLWLWWLCRNNFISIIKANANANEGIFVKFLPNLQHSNYYPRYHLFRLAFLSNVLSKVDGSGRLQIIGLNVVVVVV